MYRYVLISPCLQSRIAYRLLDRQVAATFLIIFRVASGKAWSHSPQEVISTLHSTSFTAGSHTRTGLESVEADPSFVQVDKSNRADGWELRDRDLQVRIDREVVSTRQWI